MDTEPSLTDISNDGRSRRRYISSLAGLVGALSLAGCSSGDGSAPESETPTAAESAATATDTTSSGTGGPALRDVVENDRLAVVAYSVGRSDSFETVAASDGEGHAVVDVAVKNKGERGYVSVPFYQGLTLRDSDATEYYPTVTGPDPQLDAGALAPGEVARGFVTFDRVPQDASGLTLAVTPAADTDGAVTIDLESVGTGRTLTQDFAVPVYDVGDTTEYEDTRFTATAVRTSTGGDLATPDAGNEFVIVDITVENTGDDEQFINTALQADLKDEAGRTYGLSTTALGTLDNGAAALPVDPGSERRAELGFEAVAGIEPLYLVMDFGLRSVGGRTFYQLR